MTLTPFDRVLDEHRALMAHYGRTQLRCSNLLVTQAREMERLQAEVLRLRARVIVRETQLAWEREDRAAWLADLPGLPRRKALAWQVEGLAARIQELAREVLRWQWRASISRHAPESMAEAAPEAPSARASGEGLAVQDAAGMRSVLCIAQDASGALVTQRMVESAEGLVAAQAAVRALCDAADDEHAALEASLVAADLVICQTGCVGHNAYWRVQDHCKRTGKPCVLVDQPQVIHVLRGSQGVRAEATASAPL